MSYDSVNVNFKKRDFQRMPDCTSEGILLLRLLAQNGYLSKIEKELKIRRRGGFGGFDIFLFLLYYFTSNPHCGISTFEEKIKLYMEPLAAIAGRSKLPASSSIFRALHAVETDYIRAISTKMLVEYSGILEVMKHPQCQTFDANGQNWQIFDFDPTVTTLRQRALPVGKDLPEPKRLTEQMKAGYSGRKRGELQFRRATLQHSGSSGWLSICNEPGNGKPRQEIAQALKVIKYCCQLLKHPLKRALIRCDGEFGGVPSLAAFIQAEIPFITRLTRPSFFQDPAFLQQIFTAKWKLVPDSGSGPRRFAADLGWMKIAPGAKTKQANGQPYEPVEVRVVISRFRPQGQSNRGVMLGKWQYELFSTCTTAQAWPAEQVIVNYFGRTTQENRFSQEDRELGLDRIFCYQLPGQEFASLIGLLVWNIRVALGFSLEPPADDKPIQPPYSSTIVPLLDKNPHRKKSTCSSSTPSDVQVPTIVSSQKSHEKNQLLCDAEKELIVSLDTLDWPNLLARRDKWSWQATQGGLHCPMGQSFLLNDVSYESSRECYKLRFCGRVNGCMNCVLHPTCFRTKNIHSKKKVTFNIPSSIALPMKSQLCSVQLLRMKCKRPAQRISSRPSIPSSPSFHFQAVLPNGPYAIHDSLFLPATARKLFCSSLYHTTIFIDLQVAESPSPSPKLVASSVEARQRKRLTWTQNRQRYALPEGSMIQMTIEGGEKLSSLLQTEAPPLLNTG